MEAAPVQPLPAWAFLVAPLDTPLGPPPTGAADEPLLGVSLLAAGTNGNGLLISTNGRASWQWGPAETLAAARQAFEGGTLIWREDRDQILVFQNNERSSYLTFDD